jgi:hypothetical protein
MKVFLTIILGIVALGLMPNIKSTGEVAEGEETNSTEHDMHLSEEDAQHDADESAAYEAKITRELGLAEEEDRTFTKAEFKELILRTLGHNETAHNSTDEDSEENRNYMEKVATRILKDTPEVISSKDIKNYLSFPKLQKLFEEIDDDEDEERHKASKNSTKTGDDHDDEDAHDEAHDHQEGQDEDEPVVKEDL